MDPGPGLEDRLSEEPAKAPLTLTDHLKYFMVDGISYSCFNGPLMVITERLSGMDWNEIEKSRSIGAITAFLTGYAYNYFGRQLGAKAVRATTESTWLKKKIVDTSVAISAAIPFYAPVLYYAGASAKEIALAVLAGSIFGALTGGAYGYLADRWRTLWELQPILHK